MWRCTKSRCHIWFCQIASKRSSCFLRSILAWIAADTLVRAGSRLLRVLGLLIPLYGVALMIVAVDNVFMRHLRGTSA
jgi:hypothetical protein